MAEQRPYLMWQADACKEPFAVTFENALARYEQRFGRPATEALVPVGMAQALGPQLLIHVEEAERIRPATVHVR